jgi:D-alanyl-D-alanine carboxypeptidase/D-alanyl-D-alanine-endopeptidase (penicillin-binding protein 4)
VFPIYGNRVSVTVGVDRAPGIMPAYFGEYVREDGLTRRLVARDPEANAFVVNTSRMMAGDTFELPFIVSEYDCARLLEDTLGRPVKLIYDQADRKLPFIQYATARDTLLKRMMQVSDNFIAEQLLMQCAFQMRGTFESDTAIAVAREMIFGGSPDPLLWVDGSGLSRYNLFTPRSLVWVLDQVMGLTSMDYITEIFPAGGQSGTLEKWYGSDPPFIYAKTGTLRNQHCLSGYLRTDSGRWLIFSFMHNHYTGDSALVKQEMQRILLQIKAAY